MIKIYWQKLFSAMPLISTQLIKMEPENLELVTEEDIFLILDSVKSFSKQKILPFLQNDFPDVSLDIK